MARRLSCGQVGSSPIILLPAPAGAPPAANTSTNTNSSAAGTSAGWQLASGAVSDATYYESCLATPQRLWDDFNGARRTTPRHPPHPPRAYVPPLQYMQ